ncbi:MAG: hypothetical protein ACLQVI_10525 [Polyangiaceae bacterium]
MTRLRLEIPFALLFPVLATLSACSGAPAPALSGAASESDGATSSPGDDAGGSQQPASGDDAASAPPASGQDASGGPPSTTTPPAEGGSDAGVPADGGSHDNAIDYAPYFPTWVWGGSGYAFSGLADLQSKSGLNEVTIAFVLSNGGCNTTQDIEQNMSDVSAFVAAGGHLKASFGGADGTYVESQCSDAASLASAIEGFVEATGITDLDFDIEQDAVLTDAVNEMRGEALKQVQDDKGIQVAFTLAANPSPNGGLTSQGLSVVSHALSAGVNVWHVNLMTMDYGDSYAGQPIAPVAIGSLTDANAQLLALVSGLTTAQVWRMLGVIPMIGQNDDSEVFSLADATTLTAFAKTNGLGLVSFWSIDRDQVCPSGADYNSCSTVDTTNFAFDDIFKGVLP